MKYLSRLLLLTAVSALLCMGLSTLFECGRVSGGRSLAQWFLFEIRRGEALNQRAIAISRSAEAKKAVLADLFAERLTFQEATEQFRAANEIVKESDSGMLARYHVPQTEEELRRQVIAWIKAEKAAHPQRAKKVAHRLETELAAKTSSAHSIQ